MLRMLLLYMMLKQQINITILLWKDAKNPFMKKSERLIVKSKEIKCRLWIAFFKYLRVINFYNQLIRILFIEI